MEISPVLNKAYRRYYYMHVSDRIMKLRQKSLSCDGNDHIMRGIIILLKSFFSDQSSSNDSSWVLAADFEKYISSLWVKY